MTTATTADDGHAGHSHAGPSAAGRPGRIALAAVLVPAFLATVAGLVALWPAQHLNREYNRLLHPAAVVDATVTSTAVAACGTGLDGLTCRDVTFRLSAGHTVRLNMNPGAGQPTLAVGDRVRLAKYVDTIGQVSYTYDDFQRSRSLLWLGLLSGLGIVAVARLRGLAAIAGAIASGLGIAKFVLPSLLSGHSPIAVAAVGSSGLLFIILYLAHGFSARTSAALVGTLSGLGLCVALSALATDATRITGLTSEDTLALTGFSAKVDLHQLLICGFVIGALGALNDVTITQASAVWELHASDVTAPAKALYARAMRIGRDHIASSVYTLLFAYAGAALPLLLIIDLLGRPAGQVVNSDMAAVEIVRAAVGVLGLVAAVPITTAVAVAVVRSSGRHTARTELPATAVG
jgi:uncharacterized membrane protein